STVMPSYVRIASSRVMPHGPPPPFGFPASATYCHEGRSMAGLSAVRIEQTTSPAPPPFGVQSSQPTLPDAVEHNGTLYTMLNFQGVPVSTGRCCPSQLIALTG